VVFRTLESSRATAAGWGFFNDDYVYMGGTSMATPLTAGAVAIMTDTDNTGETARAWYDDIVLRRE